MRKSIFVLATSILLASIATPAQAADSRTCAQGGACVVGDIGPGGGVVFFAKAVGGYSIHVGVTYTDPDAGSVEWNSDIVMDAATQAALPFQYLEVAPITDFVARATASNNDHDGFGDTAVGAGQIGTTTIMQLYPNDTADNNAAFYADAYTSGGISDWFLPSVDEAGILGDAHILGQLGAHDPLPNAAFNMSSTKIGYGFQYNAGLHILKDWHYGSTVGLTTIPIRSFSQTVPANPPVVSPKGTKVTGSAALTFKAGQSVMSASGKKAIAAVVSKVGKSGKYVVRGVATPLPGATTKQVRLLATNRAAAVKAYLLTLGVKAPSITLKIAIAKAHTRPVSTVSGSGVR